MATIQVTCRQRPRGVILFVGFTLLACLALSGCVTHPSPGVVRKDIWKNTGSIILISEPVDATHYQITASGSGSSREKDILEAWDEFAGKIANRRPYTASRVIERYTYGGEPLLPVHHAKRAVGR